MWKVRDSPRISCVAEVGLEHFRLGKGHGHRYPNIYCILSGLNNINLLMYCPTAISTNSQYQEISYS